MYKTLHGLVLREVKYKESSKILTILTEEEGKITAEARGALRKGSKCSAASQVLTWSELTFFENRGRYTLTEGSVLHGLRLAHARKAAPESLRRRRPLHRLRARRAGKVSAALRRVARRHASRVLGGGEEDLFLYAGRVVGRALLHGLRGIHPRAARPRLRYARLLALAAKSVNDNILMLTILR